MTSWHLSVIATLSLTVVLPVGGAQDAAAPQTMPGSRLSIAVHRGRVTASIEKSPLLTVLEELSSRTRVAIRPGSGLEGEQLSAELKNAPVDEGLRDLLKNYDTFFYYSPAGPQSAASLAGVWVYPRGAAATLRPVPPEAWAGTKDLEAALSDRDAAVREQAYEALMSRPDGASHNLVVLAIRGASETDAELRQRLLSTALSKGIDVPHEVLADLARADGTEAIRLMALDGLAGDPAAREVAVAALTDPSELMRARAKDFLVELDSIALRRDPSIR